jgi:hypothetical protein
MAAMKYVGDGRWLVGVPARDLSSDELARLPDRIRVRIKKSGLYEPARAPKEAAK